jgi:hypothetical protein
MSNRLQNVNGILLPCHPVEHHPPMGLDVTDIVVLLGIFFGVVVLEEALLIGALVYQHRLSRQLSEKAKDWAMLPIYKWFMHLTTLQLLIDGALAFWLAVGRKTSAPPDFLLFVTQFCDHFACEGVPSSSSSPFIIPNRHRLLGLAAGSGPQCAVSQSHRRVHLCVHSRCHLDQQLDMALSQLLRQPTVVPAQHHPHCSAHCVLFRAPPCPHTHLVSKARNEDSGDRHSPSAHIPPYRVFDQHHTRDHGQRGLLYLRRLALVLLRHSLQIVIFGCYLVSQFMVPIVMYFALVQDSRFWCGLTEWTRKESHSRIPLLSPLASSSVQRLTSNLDEMSSVLLNFAYLDIDRGTILGQGSSARVYAGMLPEFSC